MAYVMAAIGQLVRRDKGQDLLEYGLLAALIAIVAIASIGTLGTTIFSVFWNGISHAL
jgi:Flp pilus assembly pilin Flp